MKAGPLRHYADPTYPTRLEVLANPELLRASGALRWSKRLEIAGAAAALLAAGLSGCSRGADTGGGPEGFVSVVVAPIFKHGEGRGATGCIMVNPPVFLSEEEALQIIREELSQQAVTAHEDAYTLEGVSIPKRRRVHGYHVSEWFYGDKELRAVVEVPNSGTPLICDLRDRKRGILIEFVSSYDYFNLGGPSDRPGMQDYDFYELADYVSRKVHRGSRSPLCFAAFYDPMVKEELSEEEWDTIFTESCQDREKRRNRVRAASLELLRQQVRDFIHWLVAQGAI